MREDRVVPKSQRNSVLVMLGVWLALLIVPAVGPVQALSTRPMTLDELIAESDHIFVAVCEKKTTAFKSGNIITTYRLRSKEHWKGQLELDADGTFELDQVGGSLKEPLPLVQHVIGSVPLVPGEEVLLFVRGIRANAAQSGGASAAPQGGLPTYLGFGAGRFSIITDSRDGKKYVTRPIGAVSSTVANDRMVQRMLGRRQKALMSRTTEELQQQSSSPRPAVIRNFDSLASVRQLVKERIESQKK